MDPFAHIRPVKLWLHKTHKNFFLVYLFTAISHLWIAAHGIFGDQDDYLLPALVEVNKFADHTTWGYWSGLIGVGLIFGLFCRTFVVSRLFLGLGIAIMLFRFLLISQAWFNGASVANSLPYLFLIIGLHVSQTLEPPINPETKRM